MGGIVSSCAVGWVAANHHPQLQAMRVTPSKIVALVIAVGYLVSAIVMWGGDARVCLYLFLPLALIWFPDEIAERSRRVAERGSRFNTPTPAPW